MSDEQETSTQETNTESTQQTEQTKETGQESDKPKTVPLKEHIELRNRAKTAEKERDDLKKMFDDQEKAKLPELERIQKEADDLRKANQELLVNQARTSAFLKAKSKIGDGFTLDGIEEKLLEKIGKIQYDPDTFEDDVLDLVDLAKKPKGSNRSVIVNNASLGQKKASEYSTIELAKLEKEDPERFKTVMDQRRANLSFNQKPHQRQ